MVATLAPGIKIVRAVNRNYLGIQRIRSAECSSLSSSQRIGLTVACGLAFALTNAYGRVASVRTHLQAIMPGLERSKGLIGRIHLKIIVIAESTNRDIDRAGGELDLNRVVIQ